MKTTHCRLSLDDSCLPEENIVTHICKFALSSFETTKQAAKFLREDLPPFEGNFAVLEHVAPRISFNKPYQIYVHMLSRAISKRRKTFKEGIKKTGVPREKLIHNHIMNSMNGSYGEIYTNTRLRAFGVIPVSWIVAACAKVQRLEISEKANFLGQMMGDREMARRYLLRSGSDYCFEVAEHFFPVRSADLFATMGEYEEDEDYSPQAAQDALYKYMRRNGVDAPNFVTDILHNPSVRFTGFAIPGKFLVWAVEKMCEDLCHGTPPCNDASVSEVMDFIVRCTFLQKKEHLLFWVKDSVREGMKNGLFTNFSATDKEVFSCFRRCVTTDSVSSQTEEGEEATSAFRPT